MDPGERHLPEEEEEGPPFLEADIRRPGDQVVREAVADRGKRLHAAGDDRHPVVTKRAARDIGREVAVIGVDGVEPGEVHALDRGYLPGDVGDDDMHRCAVAEHLEQAMGVDDPACPGDPDDEFFLHVLLMRYATTSLSCFVARFTRSTSIAACSTAWRCSSVV